MVDLSIIIVSYNTKDITVRSIEALRTALISSPLTYEIIVVDNNSTDGSLEILQTLPVKLISLPENIGFARANNRGVTDAQGKYILYLNSDVIIDRVNFADLMTYLDRNPEVGVLTVQVNLVKNGIDPASHRGFPTLWRSITYMTGLERLLARFGPFKRVFGGYHLLHLDLNTVHEIDSPTGAFYLTRKEIVEKLNGFDEKFFMYGEDLDLSFRIKKLGYKIVYYPVYSVTHLKHSSGLKGDMAGVRTKTRKHFYDAMKIFYDKHYAHQYPGFINGLVHLMIYLKSR